MLVNEPMGQYFAENPDAISSMKNLLDVDLIEEQDITDAMVYLCGRSGRYVTGITLPVDAGYVLR